MPAMSPPIAITPEEVRAQCDAVRARGQKVGFVPTMGALHAGHVALVEDAKRHAGFVVVSIFVNATQFGPNDDFARYPRDLEGDRRTLSPAGVDLVFAPDAKTMYADDDRTRVVVGGVAEPLEGVHRPGHFEGVATVVAKLLHVVGPCVAVFGRKDYQQLLVIRRMVRDMLSPVEVVGHRTVREADGLAMSSRNAYLSSGERARALSVVQGLDAASRSFEGGERRPRELERIARDPIERAATSIDYVEVRDAGSLGPVDGPIGGSIVGPIAGDVGPRALLAVACRVGTTRLIDNVVLGEEPPPLG
jgi:pantoate--beta-alanine ligase